MRTFENFRKVINESDYILSEAQRYLEILLEKDSEALKQYKASKKSFQKGFGKNIKPTVVQPGLDLYKAGGPFVPDKTTFKNTGKKVPKMEPKPQFGKPKNTNKAPDRTGLKKAIADVRASDKRLYDAGVGKKPSLVQQRKHIKRRIKELSRQTTLKDKLYGSTGSTEGAGGANTGTKPQKSASASEYTKKINQANPNRPESKVNTSGYSQSNKPTPGSEPTLFKRVKPNKTPNNIPVTPSEVVGSSPFDSKSGVKSKGTRTITTTVPQKGKELKPRVITKTRKVKSTIFNPPGMIDRRQYKGPAKNPNVQLPKFLNMRTGNINVTKTKGAVDYSKLSSANKAFARTSSAIVRKTPKALKPVVSGIAKTGLKLGRGGRLGVAGGLVSAALSPAGRRFIGTALAGGGLAYFANRKGPPKLKVGDGITKTTNLPSKFQPKNAKNLSYVDAYGKKRKLESGDVRFKFGLTGTKKNKDGTVTPGGMQYNKQDMARVKNIQKKYIDSYNASVKGNPFKKQIKYKVEKDGSYTVTPPKKK